jgi:hypothetical protein
MKTLILILMMCVATNAFAGEWFCMDESSEKIDNVVRVCGLGESQEEGPARIKAFKNAWEEFYQLCKSSTDCAGHHFNSKPLRTECDETDRGYKCYRMIEFTIIQPQ